MDKLRKLQEWFNSDGFRTALGAGSLSVLKPNGELYTILVRKDGTLDTRKAYSVRQI